ncbi:MAG: hypothetical protein ACOCZ6_03330, partial [Nanoarchaeota archaeon]
GSKNSLIPHIPCNFNCNKSIEYAQKILRVLNLYKKQGDIGYIFFEGGGYIKLAGKYTNEILYYSNNKIKLNFIKRYIESDKDLEKLYGQLKKGDAFTNNFKVYLQEKEVYEFDSGLRYNFLVFKGPGLNHPKSFVYQE